MLDDAAGGDDVIGAARIEEVGDDHAQTPSRTAMSKMTNGVDEAGFSRGREFGEITEQTLERALAADSGQWSERFACEGVDGHPVHVIQGDVGQRGDRLPCGSGLCGASNFDVSHARALVQEEVDRQILIFEEQAQEEFFEALPEVPVDGAIVVAGDILPNIGEFDTGASMA